MHVNPETIEVFGIALIELWSDPLLARFVSGELDVSDLDIRTGAEL